MSLMQHEERRRGKDTIIMKKIGRLSIEYRHRSPENRGGRFGGGWNWKAGFQAGSGTLIINLLVATLRFDLEEKSAAPLTPPRSTSGSEGRKPIPDL